MNRRNFMKILGLSPILGVLGCKKSPGPVELPDMAIKFRDHKKVLHSEFDPNREYRISRRYVFKEEGNSAKKVAFSEICDFVPAEQHDKIHGLCHDPMPDNPEINWRTGQIAYHYSPNNIPRSKLAEWIEAKKRLNA